MALPPSLWSPSSRRLLRRPRRAVLALVALTALASILASACEGDPAGASSEDDASAPDGSAPSPSADAGDGASVEDAPFEADPNPAPCTRELEARPAPASLYDALLVDLAALADDAKQSRVAIFYDAVVAAGGAPLEDPLTGRVVYLARGAPPGDHWAVATSLTGFDASAATPLVAVPGTDLHAASVTVPRGASYRYKLASAGTLYEDPLARNVAWDGAAVPELGPGGFAAVAHAMDLPMSEGRVVRAGVLTSAGLGASRDVWLYLPARHEDGSCAKLPSIVFHDGNAMLTHARFAGHADALFAASPDLAAVGVFVAAAPTLAARFDEYTFGEATSKGAEHVAFVRDQVWPLATASARLCTAAGARGIAGASLGGLIASWAAFENATTWGWVGAQSASFWWRSNELINRVQNDAKIDVRFYVDSGCPATEDNCGAVSMMATALANKGYDYTRITMDGGEHTWADFSTRFDDMLTHFRQGKTTICD